MNTEKALKLQAYYRKKYGLRDDETYDPYEHEHVPALAFGPLGPSNRLVGDGNPLNPEVDLFQALGVQGKEAPQ